MRILVADDEALVRYSIISILGDVLGESPNIVEASNGRELVEQSRDTRPHIGFVDIRMPEMDGLEGITAAREFAPRTLWVIVSGHGDFKYAQKALKLGVEDFLLKPVDPDEMRTLLDKLIGKARERQRLGNRDLESRISAVLGDTTSPQYDPWFDKPRFWQAGMILWDSLLPDADATAQRRAFAARMKELLDAGDDDSGCILSYSGEALLIVFAMPTGGVPAGTDLDPSSWWNRGTRVAGGLPMDTVIDLWHRRFQALLAEGRRVIGEGIGDTWLLTRVVQDPIELFREIDHLGRGGSLRFLHRSSELMDYADISGPFGSSRHLAVADLLDEMRAAYLLGAEDDFHGMAHRLIDSVGRLGNMEGLDGGPAWYARRVIPLGDPPVANLRDLAQRLHDEGHALFAGQPARGEDVQANQSLVDRAMAVMGRRYRETIGIAQVAEDLGVTPNYLSTVFKKETGTGFTRRLTELRLDKSRELLERPDANVGEVARSLGYQSSRHFTRLFKERFSVTPSQWIADRRK